ncbi:glycosyltransferase [Winogradskyella ursingii]|uniref:glycosyltransferase n=1 Tax=Winogradskyella ursingii TaxID=2686079 RepID=UPI0015CA87D2|nr:glycosyltransferase [Winogradskyella ursingii]
MVLTSLLFYTFIAVVTLQIAYYFSFLFSFSVVKPQINKQKNIPLSVIVCAKNEAENLKRNIPLILGQNHPNFEIVLVNDSSSDDTLDIMKSFDARNPNVKVVNVVSNETFWGNKKYALTLGIKASTHDFLIFTDADCKPNSLDWLMHVSSHFSNQKSVVLGYGAYAKKKFSFLNQLIRFETVMTALQYFSYANMGIPYMGVGRNMAYRKSLFFNNSGFKNHVKLKSGDDDLFINEVSTKTNTSICYNKESFTVSQPKLNFKAWILQKRRHISTAKFYRPLHKFLLGLFYITQFLFWAVGIGLLITNYHWEWVISLIVLRFVIQWTTLAYTTKKLDESDLTFFVPILEFFLVITQLSIFSANLIAQPKHWK